MLFALGEPVAFVALVVAFLLGLALRTVAMRFTARVVGLGDGRPPMRFSLRHDIDPFGAVSAAIGGMGWGRQVTVDEVPRWRGRGRAAAVFAAGPVACILAGELLIAGYALFFPAEWLGLPPGVILRGFQPLAAGGQIVLSLGVGLLTFGLLALIPIPPLDGFGIMYNALRKPGPSTAWLRLWFEDKNIGALVLLACGFFPLNYPILLRVIDFLGVLFLRIWV
ncbi:zinc metalloprotease [Actinoplanes philippinensis]|uniref:Zn-dependent protease (Includes SpoIVFB) n=1 Tax=Actinoplanes philippinensis TaxID=35752 RepID=A0A1I2HAQ1_9ACTN|nr:hypothetical protein [Actinoplanes philippinensis]GIE81644.1 zinc metalloprotease [Actinoplanes philippinensis]SFF27264.1 hypothetical protein SAMN05421541_10834 [Actinoplanes philippinensis]